MLFNPTHRNFYFNQFDVRIKNIFYNPMLAITKMSEKMPCPVISGLILGAL